MDELSSFCRARGVRWPRLCARLFFLLVLSFVGFGLVFEYWILSKLTEIWSTAAEPYLTPNPECFPSESELVNFPNCRSKWEWMKEGWRTDECYASMGVDGTGCSFRRFLSNVEKHCPVMEGERARQQMTIAKPNFSLRELLAKMVDRPLHFEFIKKRISEMWESWKAAYEENVKTHAKSMENRRRLRILLHLGFLSDGNFAKDSSRGGPLGELVQWSDLIASLHILGHDIRVSTLTDTVVRNIDSFSRSGPCPSDNQVDLVFADIVGLKEMKKNRTHFIEANKCKLRLLDSFGTQAEFNSREYYTAHAAELRNTTNIWGGQGLALRQFLTLYPHTPDNTFLGFVVNTHHNGMQHMNRSGVLVYGKQKYMWRKAGEAVRTVMNVTEVHATVADASDASALPKGVINHGLLGTKELHLLYSKVRIFLGLGFPYEGPAPLEAVAYGAVFINPRFSPPKGRLTEKFFAEKPTLRALTSQSPYLEEMGEPWVITVDTANTTALKEAVQRAMRSQVTPRLPAELTASGMLLRVSLIVDRLNTCEAMPVWPPPTALRERVGKEGASCESTCASAGLRCDFALFPLVNKKEKLMETMGCQTVSVAPSIVAPSRCTLQENVLLYSCSSSVKGTARLCPCRDFIPDQRELCTQCL